MEINWMFFDWNRQKSPQGEPHTKIAENNDFCPFGFSGAPIKWSTSPPRITVEGPPRVSLIHLD